MAVCTAAWILVSGSAVFCLEPSAGADPDAPGTSVPVPSPVPLPVSPPAVSPPAFAPPVAWPQLGRSDRLEIVGSDQTVGTDIPVPPGLMPGLLIGQVGSVVNTIGGRVDVIDGRGVLLGSIPVPGDESAVPFAVDISRADVVAGAAKLNFVLRDQNPPADSCGRSPSLTLAQLASSYRGQAPFPVLVSDFLPGYVEQILIRTGPYPTTGQQQAALDLVASLTRYYRPMPVGVEIDTSAGPVPPGPPERRVIELREDSESGIAVRDPGSPDAVLVISGRGRELGDQVALFTDRRLELAQAPSATVRTAMTTAPAGTTLKTFAQLGMAGEISVLGTATLYVGFDAGEFAVGPVQEARVHLLAHYTPVGSGEASVVVRSGNTVLGSRRLDDSGLLDLSGTIPPESIQSTVGIAVELRYLPSQRCAPLNDRMRFTLDPQSSVAVTLGSHNRGGFPLLPMAFTPEFNVALDQPDRLRYAAELVNLLGQQTSVTLQPRVVSMAEATGSRLGALIVASDRELAHSGLRPPIVSQAADSVDIGGAIATDVNLNGPLGVVQAFGDQGRMVLAVDASQDWSLVDRCLDYIRAQPSRWASLSGDVVATGAAGQTVNLTVRSGGAMVDEYPGDSWKWWTWITAAAVAGALTVAGSILLRHRRSRHAR